MAIYPKATSKLNIFYDVGDAISPPDFINTERTSNQVGWRVKLVDKIVALGFLEFTLRKKNFWCP